MACVGGYCVLRLRQPLIFMDVLPAPKHFQIANEAGNKREPEVQVHVQFAQ